MKTFIFISFIIFIVCACSKEPIPIRFGEDGCSYCRMLISDQRYGGELLTTKGKAYKFDSIECMAAYILEKKEGSDDLLNLWTINFDQPENFIEAKQSWYLHSDSLRSPMGLNLSSFLNQANVESAQNLYAGQIIRWQEVKELVRQKWLNK